MPPEQKKKRIGNYIDEAAAVRRVNKLITHGIHTGYRVFADGSASLLHDPDYLDESRHDRPAADQPEDD
jgi:hypothetical protein